MEPSIRHSSRLRNHHDIDILTAKGTADGRLHDPHLTLEQAAGCGYPLFNMVRKFAGAVNRNAAIFRHHNRHIRFQSGMLNTLSPIGALQNDIRLPEALIHIALGNLMLAGHVVCQTVGLIEYHRRLFRQSLRRVKHTGQRPVIHLYQSCPLICGSLRLRRYHCHAVTGRIDDIHCQHGLILRPLIDS